MARLYVPIPDDKAVEAAMLKLMHDKGYRLEADGVYRRPKESENGKI